MNTPDAAEVDDLHPEQTAAEFHALGSMFGPIKDPIGRGRDGNAIRYSDMRQTIDAGFVLTDEMRAKHDDLSLGGPAGGGRTHAVADAAGPRATALESLSHSAGHR